MSDPTRGAGTTPAPRPVVLPTHEWGATMYGSANAQGQTPDAPRSKSRSFMDRLRNGIGEGNLVDRTLTRAGELARSVPRGLANLGNNIVRTGAELGAGALDAAGIGGTEEEQDARRERAKGAQAISEEELDAFYGARSDDPIASFAESATQVAGSMLLLRGAGVSNVVVGGAVTDAVAFNPYEDSLSELAARYGENIPGIGGLAAELGKLGSVDEDDNALVARLKRATEGVVAGAVVDGLVWGTRKVKALRTAEDPATPALAREEALAKAAEADERLAEIVDGRQAASPEDAVTARPTDDGYWTLEVNPKHEAAQTPLAPEPPKVEGVPGVTLNADNTVSVSGFRGVGGARHPLEPGLGGATFISPDETVAKGYATQGGREAEGTVAKMDATLRNPLVIENFRDDPLFETMDLEEVIAHAQREGHDGLVIKQGHGGHPEVAIFDQNKIDIDAPKFADRGEAEASAATINSSINQRVKARAPRVWTDEEVAQHVETAERLASAPTAAEAEALLNGTHFNFHYMGGSERVKSQIESLSKHWKSALDAAQVRTGVPNEVTIKLAKQAAQNLGIRDFAANFKLTSDQMSRQHVELIMGNRAVEQLGEQIADVSKRLRTRPHDEALKDDARDLLQTWFDLTKDVAGANSSAGRTLQILQARSLPEAQGIRFPKETPAPKAKAAAAPKADAPAKPDPKMLDGMTDEEVESFLRMFERSGGKVRNAQAVIDGLKVLADPKKSLGSKALDVASTVFINSLISGARTFETIFSSGLTLNVFEALNKTLAGAASFNPAQAREGADLLYGYFRYAADNVRSAAAAFRESRSVIDPSPNLYAQGGLGMGVVQLPGRTAGALDEFTRVTAYRAFERAKALRQARSEGLTGQALVARVEADVQRSIDPKTGVGLNQTALDFAGVPTLSDPLGAGTFSGDISAALAKYPATKFVIPFIRPGVHTFRYVAKATPGLNLFYKEMRETLLGNKGAEAAAEAWTRTALAGAMYTYAWSKVADGTITGRGPSNPTLKKAWLQNHQPYSIKIGGEYHSFRRMEPFGTFLGLAADAHLILMEAEEQEGAETPQLAGAVFGALLSNLANKSYTQGLSEFLTAVDDQDFSSVSRFLGMVGAGFIPAAAKQFNTDPYYREAQSFVDRLQQNTPGLSDNLLPKYNFAGEPVLKGGSLWNRNFSVMREKDASPDIVADELVESGIMLSPPPVKQFKGAIDFGSAEWTRDGQKVPYERWMELVSGGWENHRPLRTILEEKIKSSEYQNASSGTASYPGGVRGIILASEAEGHYEAALHKMLREYPDLKKAWEGAHALSANARVYGQNGVDQVRSKFGIPKP